VKTSIISQEVFVLAVSLKLGPWSVKASSELWSVDDTSPEPVLQLTGHTQVEHIRDSQVALIDWDGSDYSLEAEMHFITCHLDDPTAGWFGLCPQSPGLFQLRSRLVYPGTPRGFTVAYVPVAHGIVPW